MKQQNWIQRGDEFASISNSAKILSELPNAIYNLEQNEISGEFFLCKLSEKFDFPFKVYGIEHKFIAHVMKTFESTKGNLGILLNGVKGTGKTVSAKLLVNAMNLPCIVISKPFNGLNDFLAKLEVDCVLFFDEFEKNFKDKTQTILSIMDGVYNTETRKVFMLTTNTTFIDENLLSRPSRIRYKKTFSNLSLETMFEYLEDNLIDKTKIREIVEFINTLSISTIDILKCVVDEINMHNCSVDDIKDILNVETATHQYKVIVSWRSDSIEDFKQEYIHHQEIIDKQEKDEDGDIIYESHADFDDWYEERLASNRSIAYLEMGDRLGNYIVKEPIDNDGVITMEDRYNGRVIFGKVMNVEDKPKLYGKQLEAYAYVL